MKYITTGLGQVLMFTDGYTHKDVAEKLNISIVRGAGFVTLQNPEHIEFFGKSDSLKIKSRGEKDKNVLLRAMW